jgi:ankyrin repeat protein
MHSKREFVNICPGANVVRLLMAKKSIAATARDNRGWTPLHIAIMANNRPVLEALLDGMGKSGAQVKYSNNITI